MAVKCRHNYSGEAYCGLCMSEKRGGNNMTDACAHTGMCPPACPCWCDTCEEDQKAIVASIVVSPSK